MKIGIMTMQRVTNYGSYLQAHALKKTIENLSSASVEFVDYYTEPSLIKNTEVPVIRQKSIMNRILRMISPSYRRYRNEQRRMGRTFSEFCNAYDQVFLPTLGVGKEKNYTPELDVLVIGSDEVFNCTQQGELVGYSRQLFGKDNKAGRLISYAASFGTTTLDKLCQYKVKDEVAELLQGFDALSVRDKNSVQIIQQLCYVTPEKHIDPVLLYEFPEVNEIKIALKDYLVVYAYADRIKADEAEAIRKFAKEKGKRILTLGFWQPFADEYVLATPIEVLAYVKNAEYVVTDTFHGTVFSIKYQVPFVTIIRDSNREKLGDLLETFGLQDRQAVSIADIGEVLMKPLTIDIQERVESKRNEALEYLRRNVLRK